MQKGFFSIETNEGYDTFEGIENPSLLWNGWHNPYFDLNTIKKILSNIGQENQFLDYDFTFYQYDEDYDVIIEKSYYDQKLESVSTCHPITFEGIKYYPIGFMCWTWYKERLTDEA